MTVTEGDWGREGGGINHNYNCYTRYTGPKIWNIIPKDIRSLSTLIYCTLIT